MRRVDGVLAITMVLLALVSALGFAQETAAPMSTAAITGTWVNNEMMPPKVVIDSDGSFSYYFPASYSKPYQGWKTEVCAPNISSEQSLALLKATSANDVSRCWSLTPFPPSAA